jgi:cytochrome c
MRHRFALASVAIAALSALFVGVQADEPALPTASADKPVAAASACDAALGKRVFGQCSICHSLDKDTPPVAGPNLHGVVGRAAASSPGFSYSKALRDSGKKWTAQALDQFLEQPMTSVPGTMMAFAGLKKAEERAAVICYIERSSE